MTRNPWIIVLAAMWLVGCKADGTDAPEFPATECAPEPAVAVIEVQLSTMQARGWVDSGLETMDTLTDEIMLASLQDALETAECVDEGHGLLAAGVEDVQVATYGAMSWLYLSSGDPTAGAVFDQRTGQMAFSMKGDWLSWETRCTPPDPLMELAPEFSEAAPPETCFRDCPAGGDGPVCHDCETEMDDLNHWGGVWALEADETWTDRNYDEVLELAMRTSVAGAFGVCGPYEMFVRGLTTPGGAYAGDVADIRMVFVLAGHADRSVLP